MKMAKIAMFVLLAVLAAPAFGAETSEGVGGESSVEPIETVIGQMFGDMALEKYEPSGLNEIVAQPEAFLDFFVRCDVRFHRLEENDGAPSHTRIDRQSYVCFAAWDVKSRIWENDDYLRTHPVFFIPRELDHRLLENPEWGAMRRAGDYQELRVWGRVVDSFAGRPWIVVDRLARLDSGSQINEEMLTQMRDAVAMSGRDRADLVIPALTDLLARRPGEPLRGAARELLGRALVVTGRAAEAVPHLSASLRQKPDDAERGYWLAKALFSAGQYRTCVTVGSDVLRHNPLDSRVQLVRGRARAALGDAEGGLLDIEAALERNPELVEAFLDKALILNQQGRVVEAMAALRAGLALAPLMTEMNRELVQLCLVQGEWAEAVREADQVLGRPAEELAAQPDLVREMQLARARAFFELNDPAQASQALQAVLSGPTPCPDALYLKAQLAQRAQDTAGAIEALEELVVCAPGEPAWHLELAQLYLLANDREKAILHLFNVLQLNPDHRETLRQLADLLQQSGQTERAQECVNRLQALESGR